MTKYSNKGKFPVTCTRFKGNLNNSSSKDLLSIRNKRALVLSPVFKIRGINFSLYTSVAAKQLRVSPPFGQGTRNYTSGYSQVDLNWVTKVVNEYNSDCFYISIYKSNKLKMGEGVTLGFYISLKDEKLIERLYLALGGCGQILKRNDSFIFRVQDSLSINEKIIPFFNKSCLQARKLAAFDS